MNVGAEWLPLIGGVALLLSPMLGFFGTWLGSRLARKSQKEANDVDRFDVFTNAMEKRLTAAESKQEKAELRIDALEEEKRISTAVNAAQGRYIRKLLRIIASHLPELEQALLAPDPGDGEYITFNNGTFTTSTDE